MREPLGLRALRLEPSGCGKSGRRALMCEPLGFRGLRFEPLGRGERGRGKISRRYYGCQALPAVRLPAHCEAFLRQLALIRFEPPPEQSHQVAIRQSMRREPTDALQQLAKLTIYREMHAVSIRTQGFESA
jgi:hypothetical protein